MNDPENFLKRWSRRKHEASGETAQPEKTGVERADRPPPSVEDTNTRQGASDSGAAAAPAQEFDVKSLPQIESIDAATDITAFMQPGVPSALRHAALRRAWSADAAIRDFMGPTENYWDAAGPEGVPGFGNLDPNLDIKRLVSEVFGESAPERAQLDSTDKAELVADSTSELANDQAENDTPVKPQQAALAADDTAALHRTENVAPQKEPTPPRPPQKIVGRHGGAKPE